MHDQRQHPGVFDGEMAEIVINGQRSVPARALELGYEYEHPGLDEALRSAVGRS